MSQSEQTLARIYAAESINAARNRRFAETADSENRQDDARRFRALAHGQQIHADKSLHILLGMTQNTDTNTSLSAEQIDTVINMCRDAIMTAAKERETVIESLMTHFMKSAMNHASVLNRQSEEAAEFHVCQICGFIAEGTVPERCPICRAVAQQFQHVE